MSKVVFGAFSSFISASVPWVPVVPFSDVPVVPLLKVPVVPLSNVPVVPVSISPVVPLSAVPVSSSFSSESSVFSCWMISSGSSSSGSLLIFQRCQMLGIEEGIIVVAQTGAQQQKVWFADNDASGSL